MYVNQLVGRFLHMLARDVLIENSGFYAIHDSRSIPSVSVRYCEVGESIHLIGNGRILFLGGDSDAIKREIMVPSRNINYAAMGFLAGLVLGILALIRWL